MDKIIIGVSGLSGSGKDAVADVLVREHGFVRISLADELKRIVMKLFKFTEDQMWGSKKNELDARYPRGEHAFGSDGLCACCGTLQRVARCYLTPRYAMQIFGTEAGRQCFQDIWLDNTLETARLLLDASEYRQFSGAIPTYTRLQGHFLAPAGDALRATGVVIPDCRFHSELIAIRSLKSGRAIRVKRPGFEAPKWNHPSETEQMSIEDCNFAHVLHNDGSLGDLKEKVAKMLSSL